MPRLSLLMMEATMLDRTNSNLFPTWTEDRVELLKLLWSEGLSCTHIAIEMGGGLTRNAVIGKVHRLGLPRRAEKAKSKTASVVAAQRLREFRAMGGLNQDRRQTQTLRAPRIEVAPFEGRQSTGEFLGKTLMDLGFNDCRYPRGGDDGEPILFCGQPTPQGSSWCPACREIVFQKPSVPVSDAERDRRTKWGEEMAARRVARFAA